MQATVIDANDNDETPKPINRIDYQ